MGWMDRLIFLYVVVSWGNPTPSYMEPTIFVDAQEQVVAIDELMLIQLGRSADTGITRCINILDTQEWICIHITRNQ